MFSYSRVPLFDHNVLQVLPLHGNNLRPNSCHGNPNFQLAINPAFWTPRTGPPQLQQANKNIAFHSVKCKWMIHGANEGGGQRPSPRSDIVQ